MSTEGMNLDQAVEAFMAPEESAESADLPVDDILETEEENTEEVDSEVDNSEEYEEEYDEEYDTDDESAETEDEPDQVEPSTIRVKVDGEEVDVTLDDLKRSYSGQGKIQKGMQEAANLRKQAEAQTQQAMQLAAELTNMYQQVQQQGFMAPPQEPSRALFDSDPIGYMEAKMQYDEDIKGFQFQQQQIAQMQQLQEQQTHEYQTQKLQAEMQVLREKVPEFSDPEKAGKLREGLVKTAVDFGYSPEELAGISDHRALLILNEARKWRQSQAKRSQVEKKAGKARPVIKPQAKKTQDPKRKQAQNSKRTLKKTGRVEDALSLIMNT